MKTVTVAHCADIHYDSDIVYMGPKGRIRKRERQASFENILKMCRQKHIEYLLIAGDLFETPEPEEKYVEGLRDKFAECDETYIFISPGNHDYITEYSPYMRENYWPDNVYIFKGGWEGVEIEEEGVSIWGAAFEEMYEREGMLGKCENDGNIHLGVLHADIRPDSLYNPISKKQIRETNIDYLALGHIHERTNPAKEGTTWYCYSGCHDGRGFDEQGECGIYVGEVWKGGCNMEFEETAGRRYYSMRVDISDMDTDEQVAEYIENNLKGNEDDIYNIVLCGNTNGRYKPDEENIRGMTDAFFCRVVSEYQSEDYMQIANENTLRGEFVRRMLKSGDMEALDIGLRAFDMEVGYYED